MENIIRLKSIDFKNIKNVKQGKVEIGKLNEETLEFDQSDIVGIYGQNGSGKTSLVEVMKILKFLLVEETLNGNKINVYDLISEEEETAILKFEFYIKNEELLNLVEYEVVLSKLDRLERNKKIESIIIKKEGLRYNTIPRKKGSQLKNMLIFNEDNNISPATLKDYITKTEETRTEFRVLKEKTHFSGKSMIFSEDFLKLLHNTIEKIEIYNILMDTIKKLQIYSKTNLVIIDNKESGAINGNIYMPLNYRYTNGNITSYGKFILDLNSSNTVVEKEYNLIEKIIGQLNIVLGKIIPNLNVSLKELNREFNEDGIKIINFQLFARKDQRELPLKYESDGIKKIISILINLIMVYNNESYCLVVDELDAGIFEYLLGEILEVISKFGQGQIIFTSHNLRPLEVLNHNDIIFTTTNRKNNYVKLKDIKASNNMRKLYMRKVMLGVEKGEELYQETDSYEIRKAFRKAGRGLNG